MKNIPGSNRVHHLHAIRRRIPKRSPIPGQHTFFTQSRRSQHAPILFLYFEQGFPQIRLARQPPWNITAGHKIIQLRQQFLHARIKLVQVRHYRHPRFTRPTRGNRRRSRVVSIHVQYARVYYPLALQFRRLQRQPLIPLPKNGPLPFVVHQNKRLLARTSLRNDQMRLDTKPRELFAM